MIGTFMKNGSRMNRLLDAAVQIWKKKEEG